MPGSGVIGKGIVFVLPIAPLWLPRPRLTVAAPSSYTGCVIRAVTMVFALAALAGPGPLRTLHVHAYEGHDHPDHHHGPAAHSHIRSHHAAHEVDRDDAGATRLESCDPGAHAVPVVFTCVSPTRPSVVAAEPAALVRLHLPSVAPTAVPTFDTRAHSPPRLTDAPLRAPPAVDLA